MNVATVARALVLLWNKSARVVDPADYQLYTWADWSRLKPHEGEACIQAVRFKLRVPEVVALSDYDRLPVAHVTFSRRNIFKRSLVEPEHDRLSIVRQCELLGVSRAAYYYDGCKTVTVEDRQLGSTRTSRSIANLWDNQGMTEQQTANVEGTR